MKIKFFYPVLILSILSLNACKKDEGFGGSAVIQGTAQHGAQRGARAESRRDVEHERSREARGVPSGL